MREYIDRETDYCPNCGAKMDLVYIAFQHQI